MNDEPKVSISTYKRKDGRKSHYLRWPDTETGKLRSKAVGTDSKRAKREAALLEDKLRRGTYQDVQQISWAAFVEDDVAKIRGTANRDKTKRALDRFGNLCRPAGPRRITFAMLESFVVKLEADDLETATINFYLRHIRAGLNRAMKRGYAARSPFDTSLFLPEEEKPPRVISDDEESAILNAADDLYGLRMWAFIHVASNVGGRNYSELIPLGWDHVTLDGDEPHVHLTNTKAHYDRIIPIHAETVAVLRRLKAQTLLNGGPFIGMHNNLERKWERIKKAAEVDPAIKMHDLRRTFVTRLSRANVPLPTVQKLAGHKDIKTTLKFYNWVSMDDWREAVEKLRRGAAAV